MFKGVNRHEWSCKTGRTVSREEMLWDVKNLKAHNVNAVRTSHYPNDSYFLSLCDEYGLYVIEETNLETMVPGRSWGPTARTNGLCPATARSGGKMCLPVPKPCWNGTKITRPS